MPAPTELLQRYDRAFGPAARTGGDALGAIPTPPSDASIEATRARLRDGQDVSGAALAALEAVVHTEGFPAVDVSNGRPAQFPPRWSFLDGDLHKAALRRALRGVGRVESNDPTRRYLGTGWVVGKGLLLTNRHVARGFVAGTGRRGLSFETFRNPGVDWKREQVPVGPDDSDRAVLTGVRLVHPYWDAALLTFDGDVPALPLCRAQPSTLEGAAVAVLGYPEEDDTLSADTRRDVFGDRFGVKRVSPGTLLPFASIPGDWDGERQTPEVQALCHDASTLGGSSGSVVLYLPRIQEGILRPREFGEVVGLHFAGQRGVMNAAVPLWELLADPRFVDALGDTAIPAPTASPTWASAWDVFEAGPVDPEASPVAPPSPAAVCDETAGPPAASASGQRLRSDAAWAARYPASASLDALEPAFRQRVRRFVGALEQTGATVVVRATWRPPERAYLMHWAWMVANREVSPASVPPSPGLPVDWAHATLEQSVAAARAMVDAFQMTCDAPLATRHTEGRAVDLDVRWTTPLVLPAPDGNLYVVEVGDTPSLQDAGRRFGVHPSDTVPGHWSEDGR